MRWLKTNSYTITKMLLNQFGVMLMGIILVNILTRKQPTLMLLASIYATVFYLILLYIMTWEQGAKDQIRVESGRAKPDRLAGLKLSAVANLPNFLLALLLLFSFLFGANGPCYLWAQTMFGVTRTVAVMWQSMYTGFINFLLPPDVIFELSGFYVLAYFLTPLPAMAASTFGYCMGRCNRRIFGFLSAKKS